MCDIRFLPLIWMLQLFEKISCRTIYGLIGQWCWTALEMVMWNELDLKPISVPWKLCYIVPSVGVYPQKNLPALTYQTYWPMVGIVSIKSKEGTVQFRDHDIADILTCWVRKKKLLIYIINEIFFSLFWQDVLFLKVARDIKFVELKLIDLFR